MSDQQKDRLERLLGQELRALPEIPAPATLLERVMKAVRERQAQPWWQRSWQGWPAGVQVLGLLGLLIMVWATSHAGAVLLEQAQMLVVGMTFGSWLEPVWRVWDLWGTVWGAGVRVFKAGGQQVLLLAALFVMGIYFACVGLGTACTRMALVRT